MKEYERPETSFSIPMTTDLADAINPPWGLKKKIFQTICADIAEAMQKDRTKVIALASNEALTCKEVAKILDE